MEKIYDIIKIFSENINGINNMLSDTIGKVLNRNVKRGSVSGSDLDWRDINILIYNTEWNLQYEYGTLISFYYGFFGMSMTYKAFRDYSWTYSENCVKDKIYNECNYLLAHSDLYWRDFALFVNDFIVPSTKLLFDKTSDVAESLRYDISRNTDFCNDNEIRINYLMVEFNNIQLNLQGVINEAINTMFDGWYREWELWKELEWKTVVETIESLQSDFDDNRKQMIAKFQDLDKQVEKLNWVIELLRLPVSSFLAYKTDYPELYEAEIKKLPEIMYDAFGINYRSISDTIEKKLDVIIPKG